MRSIRRRGHRKFYEFVQPCQRSRRFHQLMRTMFMLNERYVRFHVRLMNIMARAFGAMAILVGITFCASAFIETDSRIIFIACGLLSIAIGVAFFLARPITVEHIYAMAGLIGISRPGTAPGDQRAPNNRIERTRDP